METFVPDRQAFELCRELCQKLEASNEVDVKALAKEHQDCPLQHPDAMKAFCSTFLMLIIGAEDARRGLYARLACELMTVWSNPITHGGQEDFFARRLHEVLQDAFETMDGNDKAASRGFAATLGELYKANVISQRVLGQVMATLLLNDERHEDKKVEWACHIVDACGSSLPGSFVESFLVKFEELLNVSRDAATQEIVKKGQPRIEDAVTQEIVLKTVDKLRKFKEERQKVRPLCEAYTDLYAELHGVRSKIVGETTSLLQRELDDLRDAVEGTGERLEDTFQQRLRSAEDVLRDLEAELATLRQESDCLEKEVAAMDQLIDAKHLDVLTRSASS